MDNTEQFNTALDRLAAASAALEQLATRITESDDSTITRIVAQIDDRRESELAEKLATAEARIAELEAAATAASQSPAASTGSRKTVSTATATLLAKQGVQLGSIEAGTLDAALTGLTLEQRFAVKAQLLRTGLLS